MSDFCDPINCSPPGSSVHVQARIMDWVAISFSKGSSRPRDRTQVSHTAGRRFNLCATREALKYKDTVSQKTSYRDTELQIQVLTSKISKGGKEARLKEGGGGKYSLKIPGGLIPNQKFDSVGFKGGAFLVNFQKMLTPCCLRVYILRTPETFTPSEMVSMGR